MTLIPANEIETDCEKDVNIWLNKMELPDGIYNKLSTYQKGVLHRCVCKPTKPVSLEERRKLYNALCSTIEFRSSNYKPSEEVTDEYLKDFFAPLSQRDRMPKDEWGGE